MYAYRIVLRTVDPRVTKLTFIIGTFRGVGGRGVGGLNADKKDLIIRLV